MSVYVCAVYVLWPWPFQNRITGFAIPFWSRIRCMQYTCIIGECASFWSSRSWRHGRLHSVVHIWICRRATSMSEHNVKRAHVWSSNTLVRMHMNVWIRRKRRSRSSENCTCTSSIRINYSSSHFSSICNSCSCIFPSHTIRIFKYNYQANHFHSHHNANIETEKQQQLHGSE